MSKRTYHREALEAEFGKLGQNSPLVELNTEKDSIITIVGRKAAPWLDLQKGETLLDIGTGLGRWAFFYAALCENVVGIDISEPLIRQARETASKRNVTNVRFFRGSFENLVESGDGSDILPDKILCVYSFHHLTDPMKAAFFERLVRRWRHPFTLVIADLMWFVDPKRIPEAWDAVFYDEGETDFPPNAFWLREAARSYFDRTLLVEIHPLVGLLVARQG